MASPIALRCLLPLVIPALIACPGCTSVQLRKSTIAQSTTLSDVYTQQVLDNLAKFIQDPYALPFFAFPNQGTTAIQDTGSIAGPGYIATNFITVPFGFAANRQATENWVLVPVSDPAKLALMRCAYQQAISSSIGQDLVSMSACPDCKELRRDFYGANERKGAHQSRHEELPCLNSSPWLSWGCKKSVPKDCHAPYVGAYRDLYVWVPPEGREMLTRLTLTILDYAVNDASQFSKRTKTVELYLDKNGNPVNSDKAVKQITAVIPIDLPSEAVADLDNYYGEFLSRFGAEMAAQLKARAAQGGVSADDINSLAYWKEIKGKDLDEFLEVFTDKKRTREAILFIQAHRIALGRMPTNDEYLRGPALYERKGSASAGLQSLGERLRAASPSK